MGYDRVMDAAAWIERFAATLFGLASGHVDLQTLRRRGGELWPTRHGDEPENVAEWDTERPYLD